MALKDIKKLKNLGFGVKKLPKQKLYQITIMKHGNCIFHRNLKYNKIGAFRKEVEANEETLKWQQ